MRYVISFRKFKKHCKYKAGGVCLNLNHEFDFMVNPVSKAKCTERLCPVLKTCVML
jgi:hypothetical protein